MWWKKGWWWNTASAEQRYKGAKFMLILAAFLLIVGITLRTNSFIVWSLIVGAFAIVQLQRAKNDR
jgi:hypothetical protein